MQEPFTYRGRTFEVKAFKGDSNEWSPEVVEIVHGESHSFYIGHEDDPDVATAEEALDEGKRYIIESVDEFGR